MFRAVLSNLKNHLQNMIIVSDFLRSYMLTVLLENWLCTHRLRIPYTLFLKLMTLIFVAVYLILKGAMSRPAHVRFQDVTFLRAHAQCVT